MGLGQAPLESSPHLPKSSPLEEQASLKLFPPSHEPFWSNQSVPHIPQFYGERSMASVIQDCTCCQAGKRPLSAFTLGRSSQTLQEFESCCLWGWGEGSDATIFEGQRGFLIPTSCMGVGNPTPASNRIPQHSDTQNHNCNPFLICNHEIRSGL